MFVAGVLSNSMRWLQLDWLGSALYNIYDRKVYKVIFLRLASGFSAAAPPHACRYLPLAISPTPCGFGGIEKRTTHIRQRSASVVDFFLTYAVLDRKGMQASSDTPARYLPVQQRARSLRGTRDVGRRQTHKAHGKPVFGSFRSRLV